VVDIPEGVYELQAEASDASGKTGVSGIVRIEVTADGMPPDDDGVDSQGGGGPHPDGGTDDDSEDPSAESGALPPGFGPGDEAGPGCTCATGPSRPTAPAWLVVSLFGLTARRRPRRRVQASASGSKTRDEEALADECMVTQMRRPVAATRDHDVPRIIHGQRQRSCTTRARTGAPESLTP
jgi:MYXO-CTERM domain-containing protein